jgi:hypothetical protein
VIEQAYAQQQGQSGPYEKFLNRRLARAKLWVDPRYGRVRRSRQGVAIEPRTPPAPQSRPTTTTQPGTGQPSTGQPSTGQPQTPTP